MRSFALHGSDDFAHDALVARGSSWLLIDLTLKDNELLHESVEETLRSFEAVLFFYMKSLDVDRQPAEHGHPNGVFSRDADLHGVHKGGGFLQP
jgi:hypothetical protein